MSKNSDTLTGGLGLPDESWEETTQRVNQQFDGNEDLSSTMLGILEELREEELGIAASSAIQSSEFERKLIMHGYILGRKFEKMITMKNMMDNPLLGAMMLSGLSKD